MAVTTVQILDLVHAWLWPFLRVVGFIVTAPVIGTRSVPARVKAGFAVVLTLVVAPLVGTQPAVAPLSASGLAIAGQQVLTGMTLGLTMRLAFLAMEVAGQLISNLMGLGFAAIVDPQNGAQVPVVSQFYTMFAVLLFLALDGHLLLVQILVESFGRIPVGEGGIARDGLESMMRLGGWLLGSGLMLALPAVVALLVVNICFGVMTRATPQLNMFAVGFPVTMLVGALVMLLSVRALEAHVGPLFLHCAELARSLAVTP